MDRVQDSLSYYAALKRAAVPVEMHLFESGMRLAAVPEVSGDQMASAGRDLAGNSRNSFGVINVT